MAKRIPPLHPDAPLLLTDHRRPRTRRELIAQSFMAGSGFVIANSLSGLFPSSAHAALSSDLQAQIQACNAGNGSGGSSMIPFLCFDLAGGANIAGSNVLVGVKGGQEKLLSTAGYKLLGLPPEQAPNSGAGNFVDRTLGLAFHSDSAFLRGIKSVCSAAAMEKVNGAVIPARSENDTGNNPHNPTYAIYHAGARGDLINLVGSQNSDSGGNSMAPPMLVDISVRPTQVTRPSDVTALVGTSTDVPELLSQADTVMAMESVARISNAAVNDGQGRQYLLSGNTAERDGAKCEIVKSADSTDKFGGSGSSSPDPARDTRITGNTGTGGSVTGIFPGGIDANGEFMKTAAIMKLVVGGVSGTGSGNRYAAAGTITMGGFDYHTGNRTAGEARDLRAGQCMGACLEYAHRVGTPLMLYVFSDGAVSSNGMPDPNAGGKLNWDSDNQSTGAAFFLVYDPNGRPELLNGDLSQQLGWMRMDGSVETAGSPGANSVTQLVDMVVLNYLALHGTNFRDTTIAAALQRQSNTILGGTSSAWNSYTAFKPIRPII